MNGDILFSEHIVDHSLTTSYLRLCNRFHCLGQKMSMQTAQIAGHFSRFTLSSAPLQRVKSPRSLFSSKEEASAFADIAVHLLLELVDDL
jgi:hypothetical protein